MCYTLINLRRVKRGDKKMGYCVVHMQKMKMSACGGIQSHINREHESKTNADIDYERTKDNYDFISTSNLKEDIRLTIEDIVKPQKAVRKDAVVCCNFIITSDYETMLRMDPEEQKQFFEDATQFFGARYGFEKIMYANVHMDERTPHLHLGLVPITEDKRLSAKTLFTPLELKELQTAFFEYVGVRYGLDRGVEGSTNKHIEMQRYKKQTLDSEISQKEEHIQKLKIQAQKGMKVVEKVKTYESRLNELETQISARERLIEDLDQVVTKKTSVASQSLGGLERVRQEIQARRQEQEKDKLLNMFKKFIELPAIKPLWERFVQEHTQKKKKKRDLIR